MISEEKMLANIESRLNDALTQLEKEEHQRFKNMTDYEVLTVAAEEYSGPIVKRLLKIITALLAGEKIDV